MNDGQANGDERARDYEGAYDPCTDLANAKRFARDHGENVRYVFERKAFYVYDLRRWTIDATGQVPRMAKLTTCKLFGAAVERFRLAGQSENADKDGAKQAKKDLFWAKTSQSQNRLNAMQALARSEPGIGVKLDVFDPRPESDWLLNCVNGTVDLRTGNLRPHRREDMLTALCPTPYDPAAKCPNFLKAIATIFGNDTGLIRFVQRYFGYCLTGDCSIHVLPVWHGGGSNGKSLLIEVFMEILGGDHAGKAAPDLLLAKYGNNHPTELADLRGKRLVVAVEAAEGRRLDEARAKELTGGDTIKARFMNGNFFQFKPTHKLIMVCNAKPKIREGGDSLWRRVVLVPFIVRFWHEGKDLAGPIELKADPRFKEKLLDEAPGILAWAVQGCRDWLTDGRNLTCPDAVRAATRNYETDENLVGRFVEDRCVTGENFIVTKHALYVAFTAWCTGENEKPYSKNEFGTRIVALGVKDGKSGGTRHWKGIELRLQTQQDTGTQPDADLGTTQDFDSHMGHRPENDESRVPASHDEPYFGAW